LGYGKEEGHLRKLRKLTRHGWPFGVDTGGKKDEGKTNQSIAGRLEGAEESPTSLKYQFAQNHELKLGIEFGIQPEGKEGQKNCGQSWSSCPRNIVERTRRKKSEGKNFRSTTVVTGRGSSTGDA